MAASKLERDVNIHLGGNAFITKYGSYQSPEIITDAGLGNWMDPESICSVFFKLAGAENFPVSLRLKVPEGSSLIRVSIAGRETYDVVIEGVESYIQPIGEFSTDAAGYVQLDIQGISKAGPYFGDVAEVILSNIVGDVIYVSDPDFFYFGRRGPSIHFNYDPQITGNIEYFYNEIRVEPGQDVIGAYFMANGFSEGYFGMQVNGFTERRILFSVWSDFDTDNPEHIPEEYRVILLEKGPNVEVYDFGGEGSGKQSFLKHYWTTDKTYKFLLTAVPLDADNTKCTAWFRPPEADWQLIASFQKPKKSTYLKGLYSFSENFLPETGHLPRQVLFQNQWIQTVDGTMKEVVKARYTGDETSRNGRHDYAGGVSEDGHFFLKNCGFFDEMVQTGVDFIRKEVNRRPQINFDNLP